LSTIDIRRTQTTNRKSCFLLLERLPVCWEDCRWSSVSADGRRLLLFLLSSSLHSHEKEGFFDNTMINEHRESRDRNNIESIRLSIWVTFFQAENYSLLPKSILISQAGGEGG
jgi:hypothetical protein